MSPLSHMHVVCAKICVRWVSDTSFSETTYDKDISERPAVHLEHVSTVVGVSMMKYNSEDGKLFEIHALS